MKFEVKISNKILKMRYSDIQEKLLVCRQASNTFFSYFNPLRIERNI